MTIRQILVLLPFLLAVTTLTARASDPIFCDCKFAQSSGYRAVGIRTMCSAMTTKNPKTGGEHCEIALALLATTNSL